MVEGERGGDAGHGEGGVGKGDGGGERGAGGPAAATDDQSSAVSVGVVTR